MILTCIIKRATAPKGHIFGFPSVSFIYIFDFTKNIQLTLIENRYFVKIEAKLCYGYKYLICTRTVYTKMDTYFLSLNLIDFRIQNNDTLTAHKI